jgi:hypothetical protein
MSRAAESASPPGAISALGLGAATGPKLIDVHQHIVPPFWFEEVMFGTDFPLVAIDDTANGFRAHGFGPAELQAIARGNAFGLFPRLNS